MNEEYGDKELICAMCGKIIKKGTLYYERDAWDFLCEECMKEVLIEKIYDEMNVRQ